MQIALLFFVFLVNSALSAEPFTLEEVLEIAFKNNPSLNELTLRIDEANGQVCKAHSAFYPNIHADADLIRGDAPSQYLFRTIDAGYFSPTTNFNDPGSFASYSYGLSIEQQLFSWGRREGVERAALSQRQAIKFRWLDYANQLIKMVTEAYLDVLKAEAFYETAESSVFLLNRQLGVAKAKLAKKTVLKTDVLKLQVRLSEAEEQSIRAHSAKQQALEILASLMGIEEADNLAIMEPRNWKNLVRDLKRVQKGELQPNAYRLWATEAEAKAADEEVSVASSYDKPSIDLFARTYFTSSSQPFHSKRVNWMAGCKVKWDLYSGGRITAQKNIARASLAQAKERVRKEERLTQEQIAIAKLKYQEAEKRLQVAKIGEHSAKESLTLLEFQYQEGVASISDYLEGERMQAETSLRASAAKYDLYKAEAEVLRSFGLLLKKD